MKYLRHQITALSVLLFHRCCYQCRKMSGYRTQHIVTQFILGVFMTLTAAAYGQSTTTEIIKSANDSRDYAYEVLDNGLKLLVISDAEAQRAAAAVDVGVGSSAEPDDYPGLAHFLEHMLFLGTDKYPDPDDYINYVSDHGGNHNAFTAFDHTNYFFDIDPAYLNEGLKRFSRFFVAPLFDEKYVERERNAVDSEYRSKLREDGWREMDVMKQIINPKHPYSRFSIGNRATLPNETVKVALLDFYKTYYSADRMTAVIIGREDTETLLKWGRELFADVPKQQAVDLTISEQLFGGIKLPVEIDSRSVKNEKNLSLHFSFPYQLDNEYSKSLGYISYILGYEGEGSLLTALKELDYASELYVGSGYKIGDETSFQLGVQLSDKGYANTDHVLAVIFAYIDLLKTDEEGKKRYQEIATIAKTGFQFKEKSRAMNEVSSLATRLSRFPVTDVQALSATFSGYNKDQIDAYLAQMTPDNAVVQITAPDKQYEHKTKYFSVPYQITELTAKQLTRVADSDKAVVAAMHLPHPNPFVADDYGLQTDEVGQQHDILDSGIELFYQNDTAFKVPRSSIKLALQPAMALSITDKTAMSLWAMLLDEQLTTVLYDAAVAGLNVDITAGENALTISLEGYQQKMPQLLQLLMQQLTDFTVDAKTFARVKADYRQDLQNTAERMPYYQTFAYLNKALLADGSLPSQRLAVIDAIDEKALKTFADKALSSLAVRIMVYGNETYKNAKQLAENIAKTLEKTKLDNSWQANKAITLEDNEEEQFATNHADSAITYYIQAGKGYPMRAAIGLLAKLIEPQFFTQLRTEKQLGYVVFAYPRPVYDHAGIGFTIQSPVATGDELQQHIREFNTAFATSLADLSEVDFTAVKTILKGELLQKPENLSAAAERYWTDILTTGKTASSQQAIADAVDEITLADFVSDMQKVLRSGKQVIIKTKANKGTQ